VTKTSNADELERRPELVERRRGYNDARAGHEPALFDGPYMIGYRRGRVEIGQPMSYLPPQSACDLLKKVFFIRAGDPKAKVLAEQSLREIIKWLDAGHGFDIVLERRDE
jgi:hypothetical protein